jgi:hypothetical protein
MTVQDIINDVRAQVQETNPNNAHKSDAGILADINACTLQLCSTINTLPKVSVSAIVAADTITLPTNLLRMDYASISDGGTPAVHAILSTIDFVNFCRITAGWEDVEANKPNSLVRMTDLTWMMFPHPSADWVGKALTIIGSVLPTPMTTTSQSPEISIVLHPVYAHYCAWKYFLLLNNPDRAALSFAAYDALRKMNTATAVSTTGSQQSFKIRGM